MDEQSQNVSESIIIGNCLSCRGLVRVPAKAPAKSVVRCPHCSESYQLAEILDQAVPELELVEGASDESDVAVVDKVLIKTDQDKEGEEREKFVVPPQLSQGARRRSRRRSSSNEASDSVDHSAVSRVNTSESGGLDYPRRRSSSTGRSRSSSRSSSKSRRGHREPNAVVELVKIVLGGLLAIPIAYLLVFWIFKQDPLNVGPSLGNVVPFLVPAEFRDDTDADPDEDANKTNRKTGSKKTEEKNPLDLPIPDVDPDLVEPDGREGSGSFDE
jgi:hypothetical protein